MRPGAILVSLLVLSLSPNARAQIFLAGALMYDANGSGGNASGAYEFDTFSTPNTANSKFNINGTTDIALALSPGANALALSGGSFGSYSGLGLFFSSTATAFAGPFAAVPNLVVVDAISSGTTFSFVNAGAMIATYGQYSGDVSYSGATSYQVGGYEVTVTGFDFGASGNNLQLFVTAVPEPSTIAGWIGLTALGVVAWRKRPRPAN